MIESLTSAGQQPSFHDTALTTALAVVTVAALIAISLQLWRAARRGDRVWARGATLAWLAVPVAAVVRLLADRSALLPAAQSADVRARGGAAARRRAGLATRPAAHRVRPVLVLVVLRGAQVVPAYAVSPEPWQQAAAQVLQRTRPGDCIAFYPLDARMAFQYFFSRMSTPGFGAPREILPDRARGPRRRSSWSATTPSPRLRSPGARRVAAGCGSSPATRASATARPDHATTARASCRCACASRMFSVTRHVDQLGYAAAIHVQLLPGPVR